MAACEKCCILYRFPKACTPIWVGVAKHIVVVEDDAVLRAAIRMQVRISWPSATLVEAGTLKEARVAIQQNPTLIILDIALPDGRGSELLPEISQLDPRPAVVAMSGVVTAQEAFSLAQQGAHAFLAKPIEIQELLDIVEHLPEVPTTSSKVARTLVGIRSIHEVQEDVRRTMLNEALRLTGWNRTAAARLLCVSRQAVQHMIRDYEIGQPEKEARL